MQPLPVHAGCRYFNLESHLDPADHANRPILDPRHSAALSPGSPTSVREPPRESAAMASDFIGLQMLVTVRGDPPRRLKGTVSAVEAGAGLTLSNG